MKKARLEPEFCQSVEAREFVIMDERHHPRARCEMAEHAPRMLFCDHSGRERLRIGLRSDGTPSMWVEGRVVPFVIPKSQGHSVPATNVLK